MRLLSKIAMSTICCPPIPADWTLADLLENLGGIPPSRIRMVPSPGTASEEDVIKAEGRSGLVCELIDGVLVEKTMGYLESLLAGAVIDALRGFVQPRNLGIVLAPDGTLRILPSQVRAPDVCFIAWAKFPGRKLAKVAIPAVAPDLAVEILSEGNTPAEMERKLLDYFSAGVRLVWYIDPQTRTARAYTAPDRCQELTERGVLSGGDVLPGFELRLGELFAELDR
jgi:Uma2 family endonuclease